MKKKNPKEVVFLDEESSSASPISIDSEDSKSEVEELSSQESSQEYSSPLVCEWSPTDEEESSIDNHQEDSFLEDHQEEEDSQSSSAPLPAEEEYNLEDAANYFNRQNGDLVCHRCGNTGHKAVDCPLGPALEPCIQCASTQHQVKNCPTNICRQYSLLSLSFSLVASNKVIRLVNVNSPISLLNAFTVPLVFIDLKFTSSLSLTCRIAP